LGGIGIFILDMAFNGSSASDLFFPPWLRQSIPPQLNVTIPYSPLSIPLLGSYFPSGQNIYPYLIGGAVLGVAMVVLILSNYNRLPESH
jgi:hypothetical protein